MTMNMDQLDANSTDLTMDPNLAYSQGDVDDLPGNDLDLSTKSVDSLEILDDEDGVEVEVQSEGESSGEENTVDDSGEASSDSALSLDVQGKKYDFKLDANDEDLRKTLRNGVKAGFWKDKVGELKSQVSKYEEEMSTLRESHEAVQELMEFAEAGDMDSIFVNILGGSEAYQEFIEQKAAELIRWENASIEEREAIEKERKYKLLSRRELELKRKADTLEKQLKDKDVSAKRSEYLQLLNNARSEHEFKVDEIADKDVRYRLNKRLWSNVSNKLDAAERKGIKITQSVTEKVYKYEAGLLRSLRGSSPAPEKPKQTAPASNANKKAEDFVDSKLASNTPDAITKKWSQTKGGKASDLLAMMMGR